MKIKLVLFPALFALIFNSVAFAQTHRGSIRGTVSDSAQTALADVPVRLIHEETNEVRTATSGASGEYIISLLPPGSYRIEVENTGFKKHIQKLTLRVNQDVRADVRLEVGQIAEEVFVTAPSTPLRKDSIALGAVIENRQVTGLPLDGRNFLELSLLVPGAVPAAQGSAGSVRGDFAFNINGAREDSNNFLLDGVYNIDPKLNTFGVKPPVDAVREFEVLASTYDASFGRNAGAQVNVVLKSGTNGLHGTVYEFFRNGALDARNFFAPSDQSDPEYKRNQFGFSLGGPIARDRTFFFADYEGTRVREGITRVTTVPTLLERRGDFSQSLFPKPVDPFTRQPFPGNTIPDFAINPIGRAIASLFPEPNRNDPFGNFVSSPSQRDRNDSFDARVDHILSTASTLVVRYSFVDRDLFEPFSGPTFAAVPGFGTNIPRRAQNAMVGETHVFSSAFVNEARFAFNRVASGAFQEGGGESVNARVGLPEFSSNPRDFGLSFITVGGFTPLGDEFNNPQHSVTNIFQALDNASYAKGRHLFKFGFDFRALQQNAFRDVQSRGFLNFQGVFTGNPLADLLIGFPTITGAARLDNHQHLRSESYNFYLNDTFRITPRLTLSAGLRYEYNSPPVDPEDRATVFDPDTRSLVRVGTGAVPRSAFEADRNNFAPRVGFAWTLTESGNTVLRGGYGVYYDQSALAPGEGLYFSPPFFDFNLFTSLPNQFLTLNDPFPTGLPSLFPDSTLAFQRDLRTPYMQHWNLNIQQQLGKSRVLEVGYVGSKGTKLLAARDFNQPAPAPVQFVIRPIPQFDDINIIESRANSNYHSLQVRLQQRLDFGLSFLSAYTWSKSIDDASNFFTSAGDPNFPQDSNNLRAERGRSNFDVRHRFSLSYSYDIPIGRGHAFLGESGWVSSLLTGWQTYGVVTLQSGRPFTVALLPDVDRSGTGRSSLGFGANDRPNVVGNPVLSDPTPDRWFDTSAFALQPFGTFGNAGRNVLDGPDFKNVNVSLVKNTGLTERLNLQFRAEAFNVFNRPNFNLPDNFLLSPTFGRVLSAQSPRHIQFGVKLLF
ncbi:MAG TPA: TonB-dependent receptor [Blastocatellia bacterium]|nr:TonB-dependent receptor [Blastocatellia bacterium]